ncbi:MAG: type II secretion system protein [Oscillospiraceae bacterium]|nr:type II secretion system protein [Oscillospiraceae bacterium]
MKKRFKGFTLIECIVALAILGIASLTMAQIYASVSLRNKQNHLVNTSLSNQMAYVEKYTGSEAIPIYFRDDGAGTSLPDPEAANTSTTKKPPHENSSTAPYVQITKVNSDKTLDTAQSYSYAADIYVLYSRDNNDKNSTESDFGSQYGDAFGVSGSVEDNYNLRYKYIVGHDNSTP